MKQTLIHKCIEEYQRLFPLDWIETLDWSDKTKYNSNYSDGIQKINDYIEISFVSISKSVISGEYLIKQDFTKDLEEFSNLLENEYSPVSSPQIKSRLYSDYQQLDGNLQILINHYRQLIYCVNNKVSQVYHKLLVNAFATNGKRLTIRQYQDLKTYVFDVYFKDHLLSYDKNNIEDLILIKESLAENENKQSKEIQPIYHILKDKCSFLIKKLVYFDGQAEYAINFSNKIIDKGSITAACFNEFDKNFEFFHKSQYSDNESYVSIWQDNCFNKRARISQMVLLIKYYKDGGNATMQQVDNLVEEFDDLYNKIYPKFSNRPFDRYALNTIQNYMHNCRLSFCMQHEYSFQEMSSDMSKIEHIQARTYIKNFYPYKKAIIYLKESIRKDIISKIIDTNGLLHQKLSMIHKYIKRLEESINWCQSQNFYPVQLLYNECIKRDSDGDIVVFTPSSFSRPLNYVELYNELQQYKLEIQLLESEIDLQKERMEIEQLKNTIEASKKSNIEILGIFTAVITFLFGCVNIFSNENNATFSITQQILHIVCLGLILLLFISALYILTLRREQCWKDYFKHPRFWFFGVMIIGYIFVLGVILYKDVFYKNTTEVKFPIEQGKEE